MKVVFVVFAFFTEERENDSSILASTVSVFILFVCLFLFSIWVFFREHSWITGLQGKGEGNSLTPHYHLHPLHIHLDISRTITADSSRLHIASSQ